MGATATVAKQNKVEGTVQVNVRIHKSFVSRLDRAAIMLGTDRSHLLRIMVAEKLPEYEERARKAQVAKDQ